MKSYTEYYSFNKQSTNTGNNIGEAGTKALNDIMKAKIIHVNLEFDGLCYI